MNFLQGTGRLLCRCLNSGGYRSPIVQSTAMYVKNFPQPKSKRRRNQIPEYYKRVMGDSRGGNIELDLDSRVPYYNHIKALDEADENVKKLMSLRFAHKRIVWESKVHYLKEKYRESLGLGPEDHISYSEHKVLEHTIRIRNIADVLKTKSRDKKNKAVLLMMIDFRAKKLRGLYHHHRERFDALLKLLDINFSLPPYKFKKPSKKERFYGAFKKRAAVQKEEALLEYQKKEEEELMNSIAEIENELKTLKAQFEQIEKGTLVISQEEEDPKS